MSSLRALKRDLLAKHDLKLFSISNHLVGQAVQAMARQPESAGQVQTTMFLGIAFTEALALIGFVVFILLKFV